MTLRLFSVILSSVALNACAQVMLRKAMVLINARTIPGRALFDLVIQTVTNPYLLFGMTLYAVSIVIWLFVLSRVEVGVAYPFQSLGYIIAAAFGFLYLGEHLSVERFSGIGLICLGLFLIARTG